MKIFIVKQTMQLNSKRAVSNIVAVLFLLLLSALTSVNAYQVGETFRDCATCPEMVVLPAGEFMMGSPEGESGRKDNEGPQHRVTIPEPFAVGKYEVTVGQFAKFVQETNHSTGYCADNPEQGSWNNPRAFNQTNNHPVVCVSWDDASAYARWLSTETGHKYRLLSEAEWEYAARAGTTTAYYFGPMLMENMAQYRSKGTATVGSFPANAFGLHDMHGNLWEWVEDCWHDDYTGAPTDGSAWISGCIKSEGKDTRVLRGGAWYSGPVFLRSAFRVWNYTPALYFVDGFRVARDLSP